MGDVLEVEVVPEEGKIELRRPTQTKARSLGGSLREYARGKRFPTDRQMSGSLRKGLIGNG